MKMVRLLLNHYTSEKYTVKEIQTPNGYILFRDPFEVEVSSSVQKIKVENTKNEWNIPNTGGIVQLFFIYWHYIKGRNISFIFPQKWKK